VQAQYAVDLFNEIKGGFLLLIFIRLKNFMPSWMSYYLIMDEAEAFVRW
jgi:hypothetical protein